MGRNFGAIKRKSQAENVSQYIPRGINVLQKIFKKHFQDFTRQYDEKYAKKYGHFRIDRITEVVEEFIKRRMGTRRLSITGSRFPGSFLRTVRTSFPVYGSPVIHTKIKSIFSNSYGFHYDSFDIELVFFFLLVSLTESNNICCLL